MTSEPERIARTFFRELSRSAWHRAAGLVCPDIVEDMAEMWRSRARRHSSDPTRADRLPIPDLPEAVTEWWRHELPGTPSAEEVMSTPASELMARYLSFAASALAGAGWEIEWRAIGTVFDEDDEAYVVCRAEGGRHRGEDDRVREWREGPPLVLVLTRSGDSWCIRNPSLILRSGGAWVVTVQE